MFTFVISLKCGDLANALLATVFLSLSAPEDPADRRCLSETARLAGVQASITFTSLSSAVAADLSVQKNLCFPSLRMKGEINRDEDFWAYFSTLIGVFIA